MSFDRNIGDIGLERRRGGHSCVPKLDCLGGGEVMSVCVFVCVVDWRGVGMGGSCDWTQRINYYKSSLGPHVYGLGISNSI